jgi:GNAT superfamily N-acetyltransferase
MTDIARLVEIRGPVRENRLSDPSRVTIADYEWHIAHGPIHIWEENGIITGFSASDPRNGSIWGLFVDPAHERRGIGQALIAAACLSLADAGHRRAKLSTVAATRAERFYLRNGWIAQGSQSEARLSSRKRCERHSTGSDTLADCPLAAHVPRVRVVSGPDTRL